jgi:8-amino-7-oxononanoate synthase
MKVLDHVRALGVFTPNAGNTPVIELPLATGEDIDAVGKLLWDRGIYVTLAAYPLVPRDQVGFRAQVTAANSDEEIDELNAVITELASAGKLRRA